MLRNMLRFTLKRLLKGMLILTVGLFVVALIAIELTDRPITPFADASLTVLPPVAPEISGTITFAIVLTATSSSPEAALFEGGSWIKMRDMAFSAMLICHPKGFVVFDTGLGRDIANQFQEFPFITKQMLKYEMTSPLADQKVMEEFCPDRPIGIIPSHLHWDHAGGIEDFSDLPVWAIPGALSAAQSQGEGKGFLPSQLDGNINWHDLSFPDGAYASYPASKDFFGDGTVVAVPMPGHSEGSIGMFVATGKHRLFLTGDVSWALEGFTRPSHKFALMRQMADGDVAALEDEILRVHALMKAVPELVVIPAHDMNAYPDWALISR